jgi:hypothetical protein
VRHKFKFIKGVDTVPQGWRSRKDSAEAANTIIKVFNTTGTIPDDLLKAYKKMLRSHKPGVVMEFYDTLATECPDVLVFFTKK